MNHDDLDARLRASAPAASIPTDLAARRGAVFRRAGGRRRARVIVGGVVAAAIVFGGGGMALAGGDHLTPWGWAGDNSFTIERPAGDDCFVGMRVMLHGVAADEPLAVDARAILSSIDLTTLDITAELAEAVAANESAPPIGVQTEDELRMQAMGAVAARITFDELAARGYEMNGDHEVSIASDGTSCR